MFDGDQIGNGKIAISQLRIVPLLKFGRLVHSFEIKARNDGQYRQVQMAVHC